jgi:hypothetical protein
MRARYWTDGAGVGLLRQTDERLPPERLDPVTLIWSATSTPPSFGVAVDAVGAVRHLLREAGSPQLPIAVIGPRAASPEELGCAEAVGHEIGALGLPLLCGGREGAMEAAARGARGAGGLVLGLLPEASWRCANASVQIPLASGLGEARNAVIASSAFALIAVGGGYGTLSEMALGMRLGRLVIALPPAPALDGVQRCATAAAAVERAAQRYLDLPP